MKRYSISPTKCLVTIWSFLITIWFLLVGKLYLIDLSNAQDNARMIERMNQPCALLFFGLVKHFDDLALPSIQKHIVGPNHQCDIYLHTYNITDLPVNPRNGEDHPARLNTSEAFLLTENVTMDTLEEFFTQRGEFLNHTRQYRYLGWGDCCQAHDNMIKQWHSIQGVWNLMVQNEQILQKAMPMQHANNDGAMHREAYFSRGYYQQIGFFRVDAYQVTPVDIFDSEAALPDFAHYTGFNDRMFYGTRTYAAIWANRFAFSKTFEETYNANAIHHHGYHSESYLKYLMKHYEVPVELKPICMWRIRSKRWLQGQDCRDMKRFGNFTQMVRFAPPGYQRNGEFLAPSIEE